MADKNKALPAIQAAEKVLTDSTRNRVNRPQSRYPQKPCQGAGSPIMAATRHLGEHGGI